MEESEDKTALRVLRGFLCAGDGLSWLGPWCSFFFSAGQDSVLEDAISFVAKGGVCGNGALF